MASPRVPWWRPIALATVAVTGIFLLTQQRGSDAAPLAQHNASERERLEKIESELHALGALAASGPDTEQSQLEARINAMKLEVTRLSRALAQRTEESPAEAGPAQSTDYQPGATAEQLGGFLEQQLAKEVADLNWSVAAAQEISRDLRGQGLENTQLGDVRCRATLCRIEASHNSMEAEQKFIGRIGSLEAFRDAEGFVQHVPRSDGGIVTMVYVSRAGHRLPSVSDVSPRM
jgi:hypothetical protein